MPMSPDVVAIEFVFGSPVQDSCEIEHGRAEC
jgi:hypothetical protein